MLACDRPGTHDGMCPAHYTRVRKYGDARADVPLRPRMDKATPAEKLDAYVDRSGGPDACWPWTRFCTKDGYGRMSVGKQMVAAHRMAHHLATGDPLDRNIEIMHSCDNPPCCNPAHLSPGSHRENMAQMSERDRARRGPTNALSRGLTEAQVAAARRIRSQGVRNQDIAELVGMSTSYISRLVRGERRPRG